MLKYEKNLWISEDENINIHEWITHEDIAEHMHEFFELVYIMQGSGTHYIDKTAYDVSRGDLIFINQEQSHSYKLNGSMRMINILIDPKFISGELLDTDSIIMLFKHSMMSEFENISKLSSQRVSFRGEELAETEALINMLVREHKQKNTGYRSVLRGGVKILFAKILRIISSKENGHDANNEEFFADIMKYIDENLASKISVAELAAKSFYNPIYFGSLLKKHCGKSFSTYIRERRMENAAMLLRTTNKHIDDIITEVGYSDRKLFYEHFKKTYRVTPGNFRKVL